MVIELQVSCALKAAARLLLQVLDESTMTWNATNPSLKAVRVCAPCLRRPFADNTAPAQVALNQQCLPVCAACHSVANESMLLSAVRPLNASIVYVRMSQGRFLHTAVSLLGKSWPYEFMLLPVVWIQAACLA